MAAEDCVDSMGHKQPGYTSLHDSTDGYEEIAWRQHTASGDTVSHNEKYISNIFTYCTALQSLGHLYWTIIVFLYLNGSTL